MRPFFFEFMDLAYLPQSFRHTMREILQVADSWPFRNYYESVAQQVRTRCQARKFLSVVELGAGTAPIAHRLMQSNLAGAPQVVVCDLNPDRANYRRIGAAPNSEQKLVVLDESFDFCKSSRKWPAPALLILSSTFHHIPYHLRTSTLQNLLKMGEEILVAESIQRNIFSFLMCFLGGPLAALVTPLALTGGWRARARRVFWCWCVPITPLAFGWDGIVSVWRCWSEAQWRGWASQAPVEVQFRQTSTTFQIEIATETSAAPALTGS